jgi:1,2-diacylglycerol 3-alpha-glucosyltransferase
MSICLVSDDFDPAMTGVGVHVKAIATALLERGHSVCVLTTRRKGEPTFELWHGVKVYRLRSLRVYGFYQALPSRKMIRTILTKEKPEIIHHHYVGFMMRTVSHIAEALSIPQVSTYHFSAHVLTRPLLMRPWRHMIERQIVAYCNRFAAVISPSKALQKELADMGITTPILCVSNGVNFTNEDLIVATSSPHIFSILFVGRLAVEKNILLLLHAFRDVLDTVSHARLTLVGDGPLRDELQAECHRLRIHEKVQFAGHIPHHELPRYYTHADVFVLPSVEETYSLVACEAMWFGTPIIVTRSIVSAHELVNEGVNGYMVDAHNSTELVERLCLLARDRMLLKRMGDASRQKVSQYGITEVITSLESVYNECIHH